MTESQLDRARWAAEAVRSLSVAQRRAAEVHELLRGGAAEPACREAMCQAIECAWSGLENLLIARGSFAREADEGQAAATADDAPTAG